MLISSSLLSPNDSDNEQERSWFGPLHVQSVTRQDRQCLANMDADPTSTRGGRGRHLCGSTKVEMSWEEDHGKTVEKTAQLSQPGNKSLPVVPNKFTAV
jgi:hypothetical protein